MRAVVLLLAASGLAACAPVKKAEPLAVSAVALANLKTAEGRSSGVATLSQRSDGLWLNVASTGLAVGTYGIHLHSVGKCDAPDFATAGPHWNPAQKQHGFDNPMGTHSGDLRNLTVNAAGVGVMETKLDQHMLDGDALDADGLSIIIHEKADDYSTDPSGNSGKRMICGVFAKG